MPGVLNLFPGVYMETDNKILKKIGGTLLFKCNLNKADILKLNIKNVFLQDTLLAWSNLIYEKQPKQLLNQVLWNNTHIRNDNKLLIFKKWIDNNIIYLNDIIDHVNGKSKTFAELQAEFNLPQSEFLNYYRLISSVPEGWIGNVTEDENENAENGMNLYDVLYKTKPDVINRTLTDIQNKRKIKGPSKHNKNGKIFFHRTILIGSLSLKMHLKFVKTILCKTSILTFYKEI